MTHQEFVAGYATGQLRISIDKAAATRFMNTRLLLPWLLLPLWGGAVALALMHAYGAALAALATAFALRWLTAATSTGFVLQRALADARFYEHVRSTGLLRIAPN